MQQLSPQDAQFLYLETNRNFGHLTYVIICDPATAPGGEVRFKQIIRHVRNRLHTSPIYRRRIHHVPLELDYPYWVDDEHFDLEYHIRHNRLPLPGDWRQFCIYISRLHSRPLDMQRPPWEMHVIEGLGGIEGCPEGAYAIATKIHHAAADGTAVINFFGGLYDIDARGTPAIPMDENRRFPVNEKPSLMDMTQRGWVNNLRYPMRVADTILKGARKVVSSNIYSLRNSERSRKRKVPDTRFNKPTSPHKVFEAAVFNLEDIKPIRALVEGSTLNDVVLAVSSGALRRYLQYHKELPEESLQAFVPVNVRSQKGSIKEEDAPGNNISNMPTVLHTDEANPVARLRKIHAETSSHKAAKTGVSARLMTDVTRHVPAGTQFLSSRFVFSSDVLGRLTNLVISNVPGPQVPVYMNGATVIGQMGMGPLGDNMGLFLGVTSYNGTICFNPTCSRTAMPDPEVFVRYIRKSFYELKGIAEEASKKTPARKSAGNRGRAKAKAKAKSAAARRRKTIKKT